MRQKHFADNDEIMYFFLEYLEECKEEKKYPNLAGFARKCFCTKQTLLNYNVESHSFFESMRLIYTFLEDETINNAMSDNFKKFYMTNTFKEYKDKQEVESTNINASVELSEEEKKEKIKELLKKYPEFLDRYK
jgi:hypothetical protein